jgi:glucuronate isomerase
MKKKNYINDNFMLFSDEAERLYHDDAARMPIIDYHCHLPPEEVAQNKTWENLTQVWLYGDHYKWRQMRTNGVDERFCTGDASDREKFDKFAETMPYLLRNPIYHWSHLELARYFDIDDCVLSPETADEIWNRTQVKFDAGISARQLMLDSNVKVVCTTDDPVDSLEHHRAVAADGFAVKMFPTFRPDKAMMPERGGYAQYVETLAAVSGVEIKSYATLIEALRNRHDFFHEHGCRLSDHGIARAYFTSVTEKEADNIFKKAWAGNPLSADDDEKFKTALMLEFGRMDAEKGWTKQLHFGALRSANTRKLKEVGPDSGFDSINDLSYAEKLAKYLDALDVENSLPKTIFYNLNPTDNEMLATMLGNFQGGSVPGKMQLGSGWWFLDQKDGMERQIEALSQLGSLSRFVGMLTDSRSFLSYTRHEYFRRVLCNVLGSDMANGFVPCDFELVGRMVRDICYNNAADFFGFEI